MAEEDTKKKKELMLKWHIEPKEGRLSIRITRGVRVFAPKGLNKKSPTETLYVPGRMFFVYFPVRVLLAFKAKIAGARREKRLTAMLEKTSLLSNMNFKDLVARAGAIQGLNRGAVSAFFTRLRRACMEMCRMQDEGYTFIKVPQEKALDRLKVGSDKKRLGTVLLYKQPEDLAALCHMLSSLAASVNVLDPKTADIEELYMLLVAIRDFSSEDARKERARIEDESKPLWERMLDDKVRGGVVRRPAGPEKRETMEPVIIRPGDGTQPKTESPQQFVDKRNNILKVFDAVMMDDALRKDPFNVAEFMQARRGEFAMGTAVYMLELLGKMGVLCAITSQGKAPVYQLDDRFYTLPQEKLELVRTVLYNLGDNINPHAVAGTKTYIENVLWNSDKGPNPRNYAVGAAPFFPEGVSLAGAVLIAGAAVIAFINLSLCVKIVRAKMFLKKYIREDDPEERRKLEERMGYVAQYQGYNRFVRVAKGVVIEGSKDARGKVKTETVFYKFYAQLLYLPIIFTRWIGEIVYGVFVTVPLRNLGIMLAVSKVRKEWKEYHTLPKDNPGRQRLYHDVKRDRNGEFKHIAEGIRVYGRKNKEGRIKIDVRIRDFQTSLRYFPMGMLIWFRQVVIDTVARFKGYICSKRSDIAEIMRNWREAREKKAKWKKLRNELKDNRLFNTAGMEMFLSKTAAYPLQADLAHKIGKACLTLEQMLSQGTNLLIAPVDGPLPWKSIELEKGLTVKDALRSGKEVNLLKVARLFHRKLQDTDMETADPSKIGEIYHIIIMISDLTLKNRETAAVRKDRINRIFKMFLPLIFILLIPSTVFAAPNLSYTYYSPSGRIETETYVDDWDGDTPADPSDDVPAGTVVHRINEDFYDNGTPGDTSDDYGRPDRKTHPDGSYEEYEYYTGTDNIHYIRGYDSGGSPVFVYEVINPTFAIKTYTNGAGASYHLDSGNQYVNAERGTDGTIRTYEYDGSWNLTEMMVYHPDGRQDRHDYAQEVVEELTPGWKFYRGANLPWIKYGYDIGDGVNGETYEGFNTKRAQLLQQLNRFKGCAVRVFIFCDLRSGVTFDGGGTPTGLSTHVFDDMDALVEAAQVLGIRLIPVVFDYMIADNVNMEGPNPVGEYPDLITDSAKRAALVNVLRPFIQRYAGRPEIEMWDILNEPIEITTSTSVTVAQVQTFITDFINMIHAEDPGSLTTIGTQNRQILLDNWTGLGQDVEQTHYYDYMVPWYPLTDDISTWGSGLTSIGFFFGELEPTSIPVKLGDIYGSAVDGGGLFWQDDTGFTITDTQADTIRHWYDSAAQRPFAPQIVSVTDSNGNRTFTVTWQPYTGALAGSVTGYTINIGGETFYISGAGTSSAVIDLPDHIYSGNYNLSIRTEVPDPQRDSDYSAPVTIWAGRSPDEGHQGGSCSMVSGKMHPRSIFGTLLPYLFLITAILLLRQGTRTRKEEQEKDDGEEEPDMPESVVRKIQKKRPAPGSMLEGFNAVMANEGFRESAFTRKDFHDNRKKEDGTFFSYTTISNELEGLAVLGILEVDKSKKPYAYKLDARLSRAPPVVLEIIRGILSSLPARPDKKQLEVKKHGIDRAMTLAGVTFSKTYDVPLAGGSTFSGFISETEKEISRFGLELPNGHKLSVAVREIFTNAWEAVRRKPERLDEEARSQYKGRIRVDAELQQKNIQIIITDNGVGIEGEAKYFLALPGSRGLMSDLPWSHKKGGGGSGMSVVRDILAKSGGYVSWKRTEEGGTRVFMTVPLIVLDEGFSVGVGDLVFRGNILEGYKTVLGKPGLSEGAFTSSQFNSYRLNKSGKPFSYRTIKSELDGMVALGILKTNGPPEPFKSTEYTLTERYSRPGKHLDPIEKVLEVLSARPSEEELVWAKAKLDGQVFAEGEELTYYYLRVLPKMNLRLIRLGAERSTLEKELKQDPENADKQQQLEGCLLKIRALRAEIALEEELVTAPEYDLKRTRGRDYRAEARENMRKALEMIDKKNEPAASALLRAAKQRFAGELLELSKTKVKMRGPRVWRDVEDKLHNVLRGQYISHGISASREVLIKEWIPHKSETIWQGIRSCDREIDNILRERDWVLDVGKRMKAYIDVLIEKKKTLPSAKTGEPLPQPEITDEEKEGMRTLLSEITENLKRAQVEEKVITHAAAGEALELLDIGEYRSMLEEMMAARSLLRKRYFSLTRQVDKIRTGRLAILREYVRARNSKTIWKLDRILEMFESGDRQKARDWMLGMTRDNDIKGEPEFHRMLPVLWQAINNIETPGKENTVRRNIGIMKERVRLMVLLDSFMDGLREKYVDARLQGKPETYYDRIFTEDFNRYLRFARDNNIGRGSPRLLWATFYLAAYVSMNMPDPEKPSKKIDSPLFPAMLDLVRMLEADSIPDLTKAIDRKKKKYANLYEILLEYDLGGFTSLDALSGTHWRRLLKALAEDMKLNEEQRRELLKVAAISNHAGHFTDIARLDIYWNRLWKGYIDAVSRGSMSGDMEEQYRQLMAESVDPRKWPEIFEEDWEEPFVEEISGLSADDLVKRFLSHYPEFNWFRKDLRKLSAFDKAEVTMNDIYTNMLVGLTPGLSPEIIRSTKERVWILREWIYRHWDGAPKEKSYDVISRTAGVKDLSEQISRDEAVASIGRYYDEGEAASKVTGYKHTVGDGHFIASPTEHLKLLSEWLLDENKRVLDMGSGTGKALAVFSRYAGHVTGVENDVALLAESEGCLVDLADVIDNRKIDMHYGSLIDEDLSQYDLIYIFWPEYGDDKYRDYVKNRLQEKLLKELKPGAYFAVISATGIERFPGLEEVTPPFTVPDVRSLTIYRKTEEPSNGPVTEKSSPENDLGAQVSDIGAFNRLENILGILRDRKGVTLSRDVVEAWLRYLDVRGLIKMEFKDGTWIVAIKDETVDYVDRTTSDEKLAVSIMRVAGALRRWVVKPEGGVSAINFKGSDGVWRVVGFESELSEDVIKHELAEVEQRRLNPSMHWTEAHNHAVENTGIGDMLDIGMPGTGRGEDIGSLFKGMFRRSSDTVTGYLELMFEHEKLDTEIKRLGKRKVVHLKDAERKLGTKVLKGMVTFLRKEAEKVAAQEATSFNAMQGISKQVSAIREKMDAIQGEIEALKGAGNKASQSSFAMSHTTVTAGEEAYNNMLAFIQDADAVRIDGPTLDTFFENVYRMAKCIEQLNEYSKIHTIGPRENIVLKNINVMMWWLFGARDDNANAKMAAVARMAVERQLKSVTDAMHGYVQARNARGAAAYLDSDPVVKMLTVQRAMSAVGKEIGINEQIYKTGNVKLLSSLWKDYLANFGKIRDAKLQALNADYVSQRREYSKAHNQRDEYEADKTKAVDKRIFIESVANRLDNFLDDRGKKKPSEKASFRDYQAGEKGIFICDVKGPVFSTGQDTHIEIDTGDIYITKESFEKLVEVDPGNMSAIAARVMRLFGERDQLLKQAVERCNTEIGFGHNKLRSLRLELGNAGEDKAKVEDVTGRMSELSGEILEMEDEKNRITGESDPAKVLDWLRKRLRSQREWVRTIGYMNFDNDYVEFRPNIRFLEQLLTNRKEMIEAEIEMIRTISHPSGHRGALLAGLQEELDMTVESLDEGFAVVNHIPDVNLGSLTYVGQSRASRPPRMVRGGEKDLWEVFTEKLVATGDYTGDDAKKIIEFGIFRIIKGDTPRVVTQPRRVVQAYRQALSEVLGKDISLSMLETYGRFHEKMHGLMTDEHVKGLVRLLKIKLGAEKFNRLRELYQAQHGKYETEEEFAEELAADYYTEKLLHNPVRLYDEKSGRRIDIEQFDENIPGYIVKAFEEVAVEIKNAWGLARNTMIIYSYKEHRKNKEKSSLDMSELKLDLFFCMGARYDDEISPYTPERFDYIFKRTIAEELGSERASQGRSLYIFMLATEFSCKDMVAFLESAYPTEYRHLIDHMRRTGKANDDRVLEIQEIGALLSISGKRTYQEQIVADINHLFRNGLNASAGGMLRSNVKHLVMHHKELIDNGGLRSFTRNLDEHTGDVEYSLTGITGNPKKMTVKVVRGVLGQMDDSRKKLEADVAELNGVISRIEEGLKQRFMKDLQKRFPQGLSERERERRVEEFEEDISKQLSPYYKTNEEVLKVLDSITMIINILSEEMDFEENISLEDVGGILRQLVISQELGFKYPRVAWAGGLDPRPISGEANICSVGSSNAIAFRVYLGSDFYPVTPDGDARNKAFAEECLEARVKVRKYDPRTRQFGEPEYFPMRYAGVGGIHDHDYVFKGDFVPEEEGTYYVTAEVRVKAYKGKEFPEVLWRPSINPQYCTEDNPSGDIVFQVEKGESRGSYALGFMGSGAAAAGIILAALVATAIIHEVARQLWIRQRVRGFAERHPAVDGFLKRVFRRSYVPGFVSHVICGILGTELGRITLKDVLTSQGIPGSPDEAVVLIDRYYHTGEQTKTLTASKLTNTGSIFIASPTQEAALIAKSFLDKDKRVLDLGSGNAKAAAIFSRYAGYVKGVEQDAVLHQEAEACMRDLDDKLDMSNVELEKGDYFNEDFSQYDLIYIFWPLYHKSVEREIKKKLEDKLARELKPGALFVINNPMPGGPFGRLEMVDDARFAKTRMIVYRNRPQSEHDLEDPEVELSEDVFSDIESSVEAGYLEGTKDLVSRVNEQSNVKALTLVGQSIKDGEHLNAQAEELMAFQAGISEWVQRMGLSLREALDLRQAVGEFALNIIEHSKEGIAENERDVYGVVACRVRREDDKLLIELFAKDNGTGCDLDGMMRKMKLIKTEGILLPGGRGIFFAATPLKDVDKESLALVSMGRRLVFKGAKDADGIPEGVITPHPSTVRGTSVRMHLRRHVQEDVAETVEAEEPQIDLEEIEARFIDSFKQKQDISWTARGRKVRATIQYDDDFENFVVAPEASYRQEHPELGILDAPASQMFIGPEGSFGQIEVKFGIMNGKPAIIFDEMQASRGYREMTNNKDRIKHRKWVESALRAMVNTAKELGIETCYASSKERIARRYSRMNIPMTDVNLWEHYEFPFKKKGWHSVALDDTEYEWDTLTEDEGGACFWQLDENEYEFTAADGPVYEELPHADVMGRIERVVPEMVNSLMTAGHNKKIVIAIDQQLGADWTRKQLRKTMNALSHLAIGDDQLGDFLRNVVIRHGKADSLSSGLGSLVDRGEVHEENIIIITNEANREAYFKRFEGTSTITGIDDEELTEDFYYPLVEIVLFTVARALKYDRENLIRCYRNISNSLDLDDDAIWQKCWDPATGTYRTTMVIKLIPGAVKLPENRSLYRDIRQYIASRA